MNAAIQSLQVVLDAERSARDEAEAAYRRTADQASAAARQLEQLIAHRDDYNRRWALRMREASSVELLRHFRGFIQRLDQAIDHQRRVCETAEQALLVRQDALREVAVRLRGVERLVERRQHAWDAQEERAEQRKSDEFAQRRATPQAPQTTTMDTSWIAG